ncbi:cation efflux family-domain-containing protein [Durotheca rogersii]|uniref:cation efflux family-domain-containing protein n=1 Tax=Durotheca rogersii TaxID=419775 RepID=UPI00222060EA|nr:cation efflux family-domain-containing protein [Durotheca rogersii]KAI5868072.1 cation efflux family-domain-containing protein [Durotheca rogersii]
MFPPALLGRPCRGHLRQAVTAAPGLATNDAGVRITRIGLYSNLGMAIAKGIGGYMFNSRAMVADAIHSLTDLASDILTLATISWSLRPPTDRFPTGFGKIESLGSLGVSSMLLFGGLWMGYGGLLTLYGHFFLDSASAADLMAHAHSHSHGHDHAGDAIPSLHAAWLAAGTVAIKEWLYHATMKVARERKSTVLASNAVHHRVDSLTGFVTLAVILGANLVENAAWLDPVGGLLISVLVVKAGVENTISALFELADRSIDDEVKGSVRKHAQRVFSDITDGHEMELRDVSGVKSGQNYLVDLEVGVPSTWTVGDIRNAEEQIRTLIGSKVRGVRKIRIRFTPKEVTTGPKFDEFIAADVSPRSTIVIASDLKVVSEAKVDFDADLGARYGVRKGVLADEAEGEVFAPVAMWVEALDLVLERLRAQGCPLGRVRGVSGSGQQHASVYWGARAEAALAALDGAPAAGPLVRQLAAAFAYPFAPNWQDHSTQAECDLFDACLGGPQQLAEATGSAAHHRFTGTQILRMRRRRPEVYEGTARISLASSFLASVLLGAIAPIDISDVTGMNLWDVAGARWHPALVALAAGDGGDGVASAALLRKLGPVPRDGGASLGTVSPYFAARYGLGAACRVAPFTGDNPATLLSLPLRPLDAIVSLGTSSTFLMNTPTYRPDPAYHFMNHPTARGHYMFMLCYKNGGLARERVRDRLPAAAAPGQPPEDPWAAFNALALATPPLGGSPDGRARLGLYFPLPEIVPNVRAGTWRYTCGAADGAGLAEAAGAWGPEADARAIVESQALSMRLRSHNLVDGGASASAPAAAGAPPPQPRRIYLVGGGSLNPAIARVFGDVLGGAEGVYRLDVGGNACALGGAYKALWALEREKKNKGRASEDDDDDDEWESFDDLLAARWREEDEVRKLDDGYRPAVFEATFTELVQVFELPYQFIRERYCTSHADQSPFVRKASPFEHVVTRCVRYAFTNLPPKVGRVFFSKPVALPFLRFRMLRHGYITSPMHWYEYKHERFRGIWIIKDPIQTPDVCVFYAHGGGFSMGSGYFYLEFLHAWQSMLGASGYRNPAVFSLEYTLVPDGSFPTQVEEAIAGYEHVLSRVQDPSRICVSGDSAGATIVLSLLLHLANLDLEKMDGIRACRLAKPGMAALISPWVTLVSNLHRNNASDYLDAGSLHRYARQYAAGKVPIDDPVLSPGSNRDVAWWKKAIPSRGIYVAYGAEEVLALDIEDWVNFLAENDVDVHSQAEEGGIHAWPVASLFLGGSLESRKQGLAALVQVIGDNVR